MRATTAVILILALATVVFIVLNLQPATVSFFGIKLVGQPLGVIVSVAFLSGALLVYFLKTGVDLRRNFWEHRQKKRSTKLAAADKDYQSGLEALGRGDNEGAREAFQQVLDKDSDHVGALFALGNLERDAGRPEKAIKLHVTANARKPGTLYILRALAEDYSLAGRLEEAIRALDDILSISPDSRYALSKKRDLYEAAGRFEEAVEAHRLLLKTGVQDDGRLSALRLNASLSALSQEKAIAHLETTIHQDKRCSAAYRLLGERLFEEAKMDDALKTWRKGWKATGDLGLLERLGEALMASDRGNKALKLYRQASSTRAGEALPALLHAQAALRLGAYREAEEVLAKGVLLGNPAAGLLKLELARKEGKAEALEQLALEAASSLASAAMPFECKACGEKTDGWSARCPSCGRWNSIRLVGLRVQPALESTPQDKALSEDKAEGTSPPS